MRAATAWLSVLIATDLKQLLQPEKAATVEEGEQLILAVISPPSAQIDESKRLD